MHMIIENLNFCFRPNEGNRGQVIIPLSPTLGVSMVAMEDGPSEIAAVVLDGKGKVKRVLSDSTPFFTIGCILDFIKQANDKYNTL
ncbi:MAG: hypothetical protein CMI60_19560 [Parvibaculum sp.]|nr:hypothetical protein [Parvibaculum sp.]